MLPLCTVHDAQIDAGCDVPWVALNLLLMRLGRFTQFASYILVVVGRDLPLFPFADMFPQLECLGEVLAGPRYSPRLM
jgi:hypothetical protein